MNRIFAELVEKHAPDDLDREMLRIGLEVVRDIKHNPLFNDQESETSALTHSEGTGMRSVLARMASAVFVQTKGLGSSLCSGSCRPARTLQRR